MGGGEQAQVVAAHPFEAGIARMRLQGELSLGQPAAQGFGINGQQTATVGQRQEGHGATPYTVNYEQAHSTQGWNKDTLVP